MDGGEQHAPPPAPAAGQTHSTHSNDHPVYNAGFAAVAEATGEPMAGPEGPGLPPVLPAEEHHTVEESEPSVDMSVNDQAHSAHRVSTGSGRPAPLSPPLLLHSTLSRAYCALRDAFPTSLYLLNLQLTYTIVCGPAIPRRFSNSRTCFPTSLWWSILTFPPTTRTTSSGR